VENLEAELKSSIAAMEASFHVGLIATYKPHLRCVPHTAHVERWLQDADADFDQFPVTIHDSIVGILFRGEHKPGQTAHDAMYPLYEGVVVSSDMPIIHLIPELSGVRAKLVLRGARVDGLVTQSDLLKLPVRLCVFSLLTHLEQVMADVIAANWKDDAWLQQLSTGRQERIADKRSDLQKRRMNPPLLDLTEFADKRDLCMALVKGSKSKFERELDALRDLRDQLAHAATFIDDAKGHKDVNEFVNKFESASYWIKELSEVSRRLRAAK
jgi:hypothetical protein